MKKLFSGVFLLALLIGLSGCFEDDGGEKAKQLTFVNASRHRVHVIPLTTEWGGFYLEEGETTTLKDIRDIDYRFEPRTKVQEGSASTARRVVFVDTPPKFE